MSLPLKRMGLNFPPLERMGLNSLLKTVMAESSGTFNPCAVFRKPSTVLQDLQQPFA